MTPPPPAVPLSAGRTIRDGGETFVSLPEVGGVIQEKAKVLLHRRVASDHYRMRLKSPIAARRARPGQFVHLRCREGNPYYPLLRRPISLLDVDPSAGALDLIYKVVGLGTRALTGVAPGDRVDFIGPLGRPFSLPPTGRKALLVGGGVGIPPLVFLAKCLLKRKAETVAFLGARTKDWVICREDFRKLGVPVRIATDDGTLGCRGSVVDLLEDELSFPRRRESSTDPRLREDDLTLYICGPTPMMAAAAALARRRRIPAQVSLEERMGCAMGCCMGCVVEVNSKPAGAHARFQRVCTEGPVFQAEAVAWKS